MPARRAMAIRCTMALVEPAIAMWTTRAFSNASLVRISRGLMSAHTISTTRAPVRAAMRPWAGVGGGIDEAPGSDRPSVSASTGHGRGRAHGRAGARQRAATASGCPAIG